LDDLKEGKRYWKLKEEAHRIALFGELRLEDAIDPTQDRLLLDLRRMS
jgi:hypothetical protein